MLCTCLAISLVFATCFVCAACPHMVSSRSFVHCACLLFMPMWLSAFQHVLCIVCLCPPQVKQMSSEDTEHKDLFKRNLSHGSLAALAAQQEAEAEFTVSRRAGQKLVALYSSLQ